jgi:tripartite-type tricarboxylate transporter receptor subunit TctC
MKIPHRRRFLHLAAGAAALPAVSGTARAQAYPTRPVRIIVGFAPGGVTDIVARFSGQWLSERLGQQFVVENRPGAATNIATETLVRAAPDGYTLLLASGANAFNAALYDDLRFNFIRDTAPIASITRTPMVMVVNPTFEAKAVLDFIAYAKANPDSVNMASSGSGSPPHVAGELFKMMTGLTMAHVPYRGDAPAITDLLAGQVQVYFATLPAAIEYVRANKLRALAVTAGSRSQALPDVPTIAEFLPDYEATTWNGLTAPKNTPAEIIEKLNREINAALGDPTFKARLS